MIGDYQLERPNMLKEGYSTDVLPISITLSKSEIEDLLNQQDATSLRIYFAMQSANNLIDAVLVATDTNGSDIIPDNNPLIINHGTRCPTICPNTSIMDR